MSLQTAQVEITLFKKFTVKVNGIDVTPGGICGEFLALMLAHRGEAVTAESYWRFVYKDDRFPFNGWQFTRAYQQVTEFLKEHHIEGILQYSLYPMRSCSINCEAVSCDYYSMLNGEIPFGAKKDYLPRFRWSSKLFRRSELYAGNHIHRRYQQICG